MRLSTPALRRLGATALLGLAAAAATAADFRFSGITDSGPLPGTAFSGSLSYDTPAQGFSGELALTAFSLHFVGQDWDLQPGASVVFDAGALLGISYLAVSADGTQRPTISFSPGFTTLAEAQMAYTVSDANGPYTGFGSYSITAVPEPGSLGLLLAGLGLVGAAARRQRA